MKENGSRKRIRFCTTLDPRLLEALKILSEEEYTTLSNLFNEAVQDILVKNNRSWK